MALDIKGLFNPTSVSIPTSHLAEIMDGGEEPTDSFTVTKNLSHCAISNEQIGKTSYYAEIAPTGGWSDLQVTIKVGGVDMSEYYSSGVINIPNVTGNIVITATAAAAPLTSITATYTQSGTVYDTDTLDSLKADLVVTANYDNGTSAVVTNYTLSGTLTEGTSTITVSYGGKTATFSVTVTHLDAYVVLVGATIAIASGGASINANTARSIYIGKIGEHPITNTYDNNNYYPIPIPSGATSMTTVLPEGVSAGMSILTYNGSIWQRTIDVGWQTAGGWTYDVSAYNGGSHYFLFNMKGANGYAANITADDVSVTFS